MSSERVSKDLLDRMSKDMSERMLENMLERMLEDMSGRKYVPSIGAPIDLDNKHSCLH